MPLTQEEAAMLINQGCQAVEPAAELRTVGWAATPLVRKGNQLGIEFFSGYHKQPEVTRIGDNKFFVSREIFDVLFPEEVAAFAEYAVREIENHRIGTGIGLIVGAAGALAGGTLEFVRNRNSKGKNVAEGLRAAADIIQGDSPSPLVSLPIASKGDKLAAGLREIADLGDKNKLASGLRQAANVIDGKGTKKSRLISRRAVNVAGAAVLFGGATGSSAKMTLDKVTAEENIKTVADDESRVLASAIRKINRWYEARQRAEKQSTPRPSNWSDTVNNGNLPPRPGRG